MPIAEPPGVCAADRRRLAAVVEAIAAKHRFVEINTVIAHGEVKWIKTARQQTLEEAEAEYIEAA
jgi:hypothetical protein